MVSKVYNYVNGVPRDALWRALKRIFLSVKVVVTLRGNAWNTIWPSMEMLYVKLGELGIDDECILKGDNHGKI